jgi:predicted O-methyltransferase YrrM
MTPERWTQIDRLLADLLIPDDPARDAAADGPGVPPHEITALEGALLHVLARAIGARRVLEIGTLAGYSTIWLARALPAGGELITLERDAHHADVARANLANANVAADLRIGPALDVLPTLTGPFDLIFIDADKRSNPQYLEHAVRLSRPGTLIVADNVIRQGAVLDGDDPDARGVRRFLELAGEHPRLIATALQTVGAKGHDGFALALVTGG